MKTLSGICLSLVLVIAACGTEDQPGPAAPRSDSTGSPSTTVPVASASPTDSSSGEVTYEVWFADERALHVAYRSKAATPAVGRAAIEDLLAGPNDAGLSTAIPEGTELLGLDISNGTATADLSTEFGEGSGSFAERMRLGQVTFTLTQFPTVDRVELRMDGEPISAFGSHGIVIDAPLRRGDFEELAPAIIVEGPRPGSVVTSPVTIGGTANVFEATVSIRILDASGREIARTFTTATCGTGCRGDYEKRVKFTVDSTQAGVIEVFEESAEDGSDINVVSIPVTLSS